MKLPAFLNRWLGRYDALIRPPTRLNLRDMLTLDPAIARVTEALRAYIVAEDAIRKNPSSWKACHPNPSTPEGIEYQRVSDLHHKAMANLWMATDIEYDEQGFRDKVWNWRYWKVMARKCCHYQLSTGTTEKAASTMAQLHNAEAEFVEACGLTELYRSPCSYIEEQFPNLKKDGRNAK